MAPTRRGPDGLTDLERDICHAIDRGLGDRAAYRAARPLAKASDLTAERYVWRIRHRPQCIAYMDKLQERSRLRHLGHKDRLVAELSNIAFADPGDLFRWGPDGVTIRDMAELSPAQRRLVARVSTTRTARGGTTRLEMHDKLQAMEKLCRMFGLYAPDSRSSEAQTAQEREPMSPVERAQRLTAILRDAKPGGSREGDGRALCRPSGPGTDCDE